MDIDSGQHWQRAFGAYRALIRDQRQDSEYLRNTGLIPNLLQLIGDVSRLRVLDAGCGTGWLFDVLEPHAGWECDVVGPEPRDIGHICSDMQDIRCLTYQDDFFDVVVSSLVLMWVDDLDVAFKELFRVTRPGGRLVVSLTHPHFHTNGTVLSDGSFLINQSLADVREKFVMISGRVGPLRHFARPLIDYYNSALEASWRIVGFRDHFIDMERYRTEIGDRTSQLRRTDKVPLFTFFVCEK